MRMMDELKHMFLYSSKKKVYVPIDEMDKRRNSAILLLSPNSDTSVELTKLPYLYNPNLFKSYYIDRNVDMYIKSVDPEVLDFDEQEEEVLSESLFSNDKVKFKLEDGTSYVDKRYIDEAYNKNTVKEYKNRFGLRHLPEEIHVKVYPNKGALTKDAPPQLVNFYKDSLCSYSKKGTIYLISKMTYDEKHYGPYNKYLLCELITYLICNENNKIPYHIARCIGMIKSGLYEWINDDDNDSYVYIPKETKPILSTLEDVIESEEHDKEYNATKKYIKTGDIKVISRFIKDRLFFGGKNMFMEGELSYFERQRLLPSEFGLPDKRKYPMPDKDHVKAAIQMFNKCDHDDDKELAENIIKKIKKFDMIDDINVGPNNRFKKYFDEFMKSLDEATSLLCIDGDNYINEIGFLGKATIGLKIHPHMELWEILKEHKYPGLYNYAKKSKDIDELSYLRQDAYIGLRTYARIKSLIETSDEWYKDYDLIENDMLKKLKKHNITVKDVDLTIKWFKEEYLKLIKDRIKELKMNESYFFESSYLNEGILDTLMNRKKDTKSGKKEPEYDYVSKDELKNIEADFRKDYNDAVRLIRPLIKDQKAFSIAPFYCGAIPSTGYNGKANYIRLVDWDLYKFYKNPRAQMNEDGGEEFNKVYNSIKNGLKEFASERGYILDDSGDWDGGTIILVKKGHAYCTEAAPIPNSEYQDVLKVCDNLSDEEFKRISFYDTYKDSKFIIHRIIKRIDGKPVAFLDLYQFPSKPEIAQITLAVDRDHRGMGLADEMVKELLDANLPEKYKFNVFYWTAHENNKASMGLALKNGFMDTKELDKYGRRIFLKPVVIEDKVWDEIPSDIKPRSEEDDYTITENALVSNNMALFTEDDSMYSTNLKRYLYKERLKNNKEVLKLYEDVKAKQPAITKTYVKISMYKKQNVFVDLSYYNSLFLSKLNYKLDRGVNFYFEFMNRLLNNPNISSEYKMGTIFIPIDPGVWNGITDVNSLWDYRKDINPISVIFRLLKSNLQLLKKEWGKKNIIFVGSRGYFKIDFSKLDVKDLVRLKKNITKLMSYSEVIEDEYETDTAEDDTETSYGVRKNNADTSKAMAMNMIDKIEKGTSIKLSNVSSISTKPPEGNADNIKPLSHIHLRVTKEPLEFGLGRNKNYDGSTAIISLDPGGADNFDKLFKNGLLKNIKNVNTYCIPK